MKRAKGVVRDLFHDLVRGVERVADTAQDLVTRRHDATATIRLMGYAGYRAAGYIYLHGRVLKATAERAIDTDAGSWERFRAMMALYNSHELEGVRVACRSSAGVQEQLSDDEGYFTFRIPSHAALPDETAWEVATLTAPGREAVVEPVEVPILAPGTDDQWGVISDIDDTVIETGATDFLKNWRRVLIESPRQRVVVPHAPDLYRRIGGGAHPVRPFFYVSSSPWNLYPFITEFMEHNALPKGVLFLRDYGIDRDKLFHSAHGTHKTAAIDQVVEAFPNRRFLLIGDSGQHDIDIYAEAISHHPERFGAVLIRDIGDDSIDAAKRATLDRIEAQGIAVYTGHDFGEARAVIAGLGLGDPEETARAAGLDEQGDDRTDEQGDDRGAEA